MLIFIRRIPEMTQIADLAAFVNPALKRGLLISPGKIIKIKILGLHEKAITQYEFHGLVEVEPEKAGRRVIEKLNGKLLKGKRVIVGEYIQRSWHNDRRTNHAEIVDHIFQGRRLGDRRRRKEVEIVRDACEIFIANPNASRKLL